MAPWVAACFGLRCAVEDAGRMAGMPSLVVPLLVLWRKAGAVGRRRTACAGPQCTAVGAVGLAGIAIAGCAPACAVAEGGCCW